MNLKHRRCLTDVVQGSECRQPVHDHLSAVKMALSLFGLPPNKDMRDNRLRRMLGLVPQTLAIYLSLSARQNLWHFARLHGLSRHEAGEGIEPDLHLTKRRRADSHQGPERHMQLLTEAEYMAATGFTLIPAIGFRSGQGPYKAWGFR